MKQLVRRGSAVALILFGLAGGLRAQSVRTNLPLWLTGSPNVGFECTLSRQFTAVADVSWMPYMFRKHEEVFRVLQGSVEARYYVNPGNFYTNDSWDGFYVGPYAMYGNFNVGFFKHGENGEGDANRSRRHKGWGVSGGITAGYKFSFNSRWGLDLNLGLGYAHLQYNKYRLGGEYADFPLRLKQTKSWIGPTKFGVHLTYNLFR